MFLRFLNRILWVTFSVDFTARLNIPPESIVRAIKSANKQTLGRTNRNECSQSVTQPRHIRGKKKCYWPACSASQPTKATASALNSSCCIGSSVEAVLLLTCESMKKKKKTEKKINLKTISCKHIRTYIPAIYISGAGSRISNNFGLLEWRASPKNRKSHTQWRSVRLDGCLDGWDAQHFTFIVSDPNMLKTHKFSDVADHMNVSMNL